MLEINIDCGENAYPYAGYRMRLEKELTLLYCTGSTDLSEFIHGITSMLYQPETLSILIQIGNYKTLDLLLANISTDVVFVFDTDVTPIFINQYLHGDFYLHGRHCVLTFNPNNKPDNFDEYENLDMDISKLSYVDKAGNLTCKSSYAYVLLSKSDDVTCFTTAMKDFKESYTYRWKQVWSQYCKRFNIKPEDEEAELTRLEKLYENNKDMASCILNDYL